MTRSGRRIRMLLMLAVAPVIAGCFTYVAVDKNGVAPGADVRVVVDRQEAVRQIDVLGDLRERVEGQVLEQTDASTLALTVRRSAVAAGGGRFNAFVTFPWSSVTRVESKRFSARRTAAIAAGAGVATALVISVVEGSSRPGGSEGPSTNNAVRIPLLRVRW